MAGPAWKARRVALVAACAALAADPLPAQQARFGERVEVERVLVDVRVVDAWGRPVLGLAPADFRVSLGGALAPLESVHWISGATPYAEGLVPAVAAATRAPAVPPGRLIVLLFQKDMESSRLTGLVRMKAWAARFLETLGPEDRVAVLSFDSHLKLWIDFTGDRALLRGVIDGWIRRDRPPRLLPGPFPSLAAHFDEAEARRASTLESALLVTARALAPLPGAKSLALFGWGLGRLAGGRLHMERDYAPALRALAAARAAVFSLDVTDADYHSLEVGLEAVAADTGGFYAKTHDFPAAAMARLEGALAGHYVLAFEKPSLPAGPHRIEVELVGRRGTVLAPRAWVD